MLYEIQSEDHLRNANEPIFCIFDDLPNDTDLNDEHSKNAYFSISKIIIFFKDLHSEKEPFPIKVIVSGIFIWDIDEHLTKVASLIAFIDDINVIDIKFELFTKEYSSIDVTEGGIIISFNE